MRTIDIIAELFNNQPKPIIEKPLKLKDIFNIKPHTQKNIKKTKKKD